MEESFIERVKRQNMEALHRGVANGWWEGVDEKRGQPIPFPFIINLATKDRGFLLAHAFHEAGLFSSVTEARKAGWGKEATPGEYWLFKRTKRVLLIYVTEE